MARVLDVYLNANLTGRLTQDDHGELGFCYDAAWLNRADAMALSVSLPLRAEPFARRECRPFFAGLLPEEIQRKLVAESFGVSERNDFSLLDKIGGECAGAVSFMPEGQTPSVKDWSSKPMTLDELATKLQELPKRPLLAGETGLRLSLAGAQSKMAVILRDGRYELPLNGAPSTHILKPQSGRFEDLVENEHFCMALAKSIGLNVAEVSIGRAGDSTFLQIARYDRQHTPDGALRRLHQEDFCQALGCVPENKYQQEGGPGLRECFDLIRRISSAPAVDLLQLLDVVVFNYLIGNGDAHGKNFSLLHETRGTRLAPFYDLLNTQIYPHLDQRFAMKIGKERDPAKVGLSDWQLLMKEAGIGVGPALRRVRDVTERVIMALAHWQEWQQGQHAIADLVNANASRLNSLVK